jgi:hypothetical protein
MTDTLLLAELSVALVDVSAASAGHRDRPAVVDLARRQVDGIARWHETAREGNGVDDETWARERDVIAIVTAHRLLAAGGPLPATSAPRAVVALRHDWFADAVSVALTQCDVTVFGRVWDAAAAVGFCVAEQPDLVLLDSGLALPHLVQRLTQLCPDTAVVVQFPDDDELRALTLTGATAVFHRQVPPHEVAAQVAALLGR